MLNSIVSLYRFKHFEAPRGFGDSGRRATYFQGFGGRVIYFQGFGEKA